MTTPFTPTDTRKFVPVAAKTISLARILGWDVRWMGTKQDAVTLRSPGGEKTINVPTTNINAKRAKAWARTIFRYTDDGHLARFVNGELDMMKEDEQTQALVVTFGSEVITMLKEKADETRDHAMTVTNASPTKPQPLPVKADIPAVDPVMQNAVETKPAKGGRYIVKVEPYMKHHANHSKKDEQGNPVMVPSEHINVVTYSDGTTEFGCADCEYTTPKGWQSVLIHRHSHTDAINRKIATRLQRKPPKGRARDRKPKPESGQTALTLGTPWTRDPEARSGALEVQQVIDAVREADIVTEPPSDIDGLMTVIRGFIEHEFERRFKALTTERDELRDKYIEAAHEVGRLRDSLTALKGLMNDL